MTTKELLEEIDKEYAIADKALSAVPKDEQLKLRAAWVPLKELNITKKHIQRIEAKKIYP